MRADTFKVYGSSLTWQGDRLMMVASGSIPLQPPIEKVKIMLRVELRSDSREVIHSIKNS
jgi:hypothetical protein